jgi:hypothetical protein
VSRGMAGFFFFPCDDTEAAAALTVGVAYSRVPVGSASIRAVGAGRRRTVLDHRLRG